MMRYLRKKDIPNYSEEMVAFDSPEKLREFTDKFKQLVIDVFGKDFVEKEESGFILALTKEERSPASDAKESDVLLKRHYMASYTFHNCIHCNEVMKICLQDMQNTMVMETGMN